MRWIVGLALAAVMAVPWIAPAPVEAGFGGGGCPASYQPTTYDEDDAEYWENLGFFFPTLQNSPLRRAAAKKDKDGDGVVCQKVGSVPGPQFVDVTIEVQESD